MEKHIPTLMLVDDNDDSYVEMPLSREQGFEIDRGENLVSAAKRFVAERPGFVTQGRL
jgi:hypothetical protein